jgi:hypothetical protein
MGRNISNFNPNIPCVGCNGLILKGNRRLPQELLSAIVFVLITVRNFPTLTLAFLALGTILTNLILF